MAIWCLRISPDGRRLVSASYNMPAKLWQWDVTRLRPKPRTSGDCQTRVGLHSTWRPSRRTAAGLVIGGHKNTVKVFDANTGQEIQNLAGHTGHVFCVAVSPDGRWIASAGDDTTVRLWDTTARKRLHTLRGHTGLVSSLAFSPDGQRWVSGSRDHTVKVWDLRRWTRSSSSKWSPSVSADLAARANSGLGLEAPARSAMRYLGQRVRNGPRSRAPGEASVSLSAMTRPHAAMQLLRATSLLKHSHPQTNDGQIYTLVNSKVPPV